MKAKVIIWRDVFGEWGAACNDREHWRDYDFLPTHADAIAWADTHCKERKHA